MSRDARNAGGLSPDRAKARAVLPREYRGIAGINAMAGPAFRDTVAQPSFRLTRIAVSRDKSLRRGIRRFVALGNTAMSNESDTAAAEKTQREIEELRRQLKELAGKYGATPQPSLQDVRRTVEQNIGDL